MSDVITLRRVLSEAVRLGRSSPKITLLSLGFVFIGYLAPDLLLDQTTAQSVYWAIALIVLYFQLLLTASVLRASGIPNYVYTPQTPTRGRFPAAFGLQLFYLAGLMVGLLLLVMPGLVLLVRWSLSLPSLLAEDASITGSLRRSWDITRHHWKVVAASSILPILLFLLVAVPALLEIPDYGKASAAPVILVDLAGAITWVSRWLIAVALYGLISHQEAIRTNSP